MASHPKLVNKQFNSPINLYSQQNVQEVLDRESQILANGAIGIDFRNPNVGKPANLKNSAVLRMLEEEEARQRNGYGPGSQHIAKPLRENITWPPPEYEHKNKLRSTYKDVVVPGTKRVAWPPPNEGSDSPYAEQNAQGGPHNQSQPPAGFQQNNYQAAPTVQQQSAPSNRAPLKPLDVRSPSGSSPLSSPSLNQTPQGFRPTTPSKGWAPVQSPVHSPSHPGFKPSAQFQSAHQPVSQQTFLGQQYTPNPPQQQYQPSQQQYQPTQQQYQQEYQSSQQNYQTSGQQYQAPQSYQSPQVQRQSSQHQISQQSQTSEQRQHYQTTRQYEYQSSQQYQTSSQNQSPKLVQSSTQTIQQFSSSQSQPSQFSQTPYQVSSPKPQTPQPQTPQPQTPQSYTPQPQYQASSQISSKPAAAPSQVAPKGPARPVELPPSTITLRPKAPVSQAPPPVFNSQPATATLKVKVGLKYLRGDQKWPPEDVRKKMLEEAENIANSNSFLSLEGGKHLRGDLKWPPENVKEQFAEENRLRLELAKGPAFKPRRPNKDYTEFFAQHALNSTYPGYKIPPGTQFFKPID